MYVVMGGSFDPVHEGHLNTAKAIQALLDVPTVYLMPAARSPLKQTTTSDQHRLAMLQLAITAYPGLTIDDRELRLPPPSYTVDTLQAIRKTLGTDEPIVWIMGNDSLNHLDQWKHWQSLTDYAHLIVIQRQGFTENYSQAVADWLKARSAPDSLNRLNCTPSGQCVCVNLPPQPFSSTTIRQALIEGLHPDGLPETVWHYIQEHRLYPGTRT